MNALVLPALGLAQRSAQSLPALFAELATRLPAPDIAWLHSAGHTISGKGAGTYIADELATEALADAHPRFVLRTANRRVFRLLPEAGSISVEQGGAVGDGLADDQPAIQAAIDSATIPSTIFSGDMSAPVGAQTGDDAAESPAKMMSSLKVVARREATSTSLSGITSLIWAASAFAFSRRAATSGCRRTPTRASCRTSGSSPRSRWASGR